MTRTPISRSPSRSPPGGPWRRTGPRRSRTTKIREGLIAAAITYEIGRVCDGLETRKGPGLLFLLSLQSRALSLGFSTTEVRDYMNDAAEKARLEGIARERAAGIGDRRGRPRDLLRRGAGGDGEGQPVGRYLAEG